MILEAARFKMKDMKKIFILLTFVFALESCHTDGKINSVLNKMRENNCYMGSAVSEDAHTPEQYMFYKTVRDSATGFKLKKLLSDKNGVIRAYALQALIERNEKMDWDKIALDALSDTEVIETMFGCIIMNEMVGDIFLDVLESKISQNTKQKIDIQLLKNRSPLNHAIFLLHSETKSPELYKLTKQWALEGNEVAIFALAKYQEKDDYELILSLKDKKDKTLFFEACPYILNDSLKPFFDEYMDSILPSKYYYSEWSDFYNSLAMFKDEFSRKELLKVFSPKINKKIQKYHLKYIADALSSYSDGFYDDILFEIWGKYNIANLTIAKNLYNHDKNRALDCMVATVNNSDEYVLDFEKFVAFCIETLLNENYDVKQIFIKKLPDITVSSFKDFFKYLNRFADDSVDQALLNHLKTEQNGHIAIPIYDYLLSKNNSLITSQVSEIYKKNKATYMDWVKQDVKKVFEKWDVAL